MHTQSERQPRRTSAIPTDFHLTGRKPYLLKCSPSGSECPSVARGEPLSVVRDASTIRCGFNVMPGRDVEETFFVREYRLWHRYMEAEFDRTYHSQMAQSPSHVIFLTALTHTQKMMYVYLCHELSIPYEPDGVERLKLWPSKVNVRMPKMVTSEKGIVHRVHLTDLVWYGNSRFKVVIQSKIDNIISIDAEAVAFLV